MKKKHRLIEEKYHLLGTRNTSVFKNIDGTPPFSAYIADLAFLEMNKEKTVNDIRKNIWDPFCGNGVILRTLAVLHRQSINTLFASDIRADAVEQTKHNISVCSASIYTSEGEYKNLLKQYKCYSEVPLKVFQHDAVVPHNVHINDETVDFILTDPPYEEMEVYFESNDHVNSINDYLPLLLTSLRQKMKDNALIGLILDKTENYSDLLNSSEGYKFKRRKLLHKNYKNRIFYLLNTTK